MDGVNETGGVLHGPIAAAPAAPIRETWGTLTNLITPETAKAERLQITQIEINPGTPPGPRHFHRHIENAFIILEGRAIMEVEGSEIVMSAGDFAWVPPGVVHQVRNGSDTEPVRLIEIYGPAAKDFNVVDDDQKEER